MPNNVKVKINKNIGIFFFFLTIFLFIYPLVYSSPPLSPYRPGETLDPSCSPGDPNCTVSPPLPTYISTTTIVELNNNLLSFNTGTVKILGELIVTNTTTFNGISYIWPSNPPNPNQFLQYIGNGNLQWADVTLSTAGGWTDDGNVVRLQTITDSVAIGTTTPSEKLTVQGNILATGGITANSLVLLTPLSITSGGTGLNSLGLANQILGVNNTGTSLEYKDITSLLIPGPGISITGTSTATISNTGVLSLNSLTGALTLQGTPNQINISSIGSNIILSTPQDISTTSSPTFANLTLSSLTSGSILFAGNNGLISQDNSNLYWDNNNKRLGIGTNNPSSLLELYSTNISPILTITSANSTTYSPQIQFRTGTTPSTQYTIGVNISDNTLRLVSSS
ncbi:MAG: hypothetical protein QXN68_06615, partial [Thermoplasmata archaeon]